jgi:ATP-dependent DNA helicase DinG
MKFAVLDFETTGMSADTDAVIQAGLVMVDGETGEARVAVSTLVRPDRPIPAWITRLTGISDADVADAPPLEDVVAQMVPLLDDAVLVAHNAAFDIRFLQAALDRCGYLPFAGRMIDTVDLARLAFPTMPGYRLETLTQALGIRHERAHRADHDAAATASLLLACLERLRRLPLLTLQRLASLFDPGRSDLGWLIHSILDWRETQPPEDETTVDHFRHFALKAADWLQDEQPEPAGEGERLPADMTFEQFAEQTKERLQALLPGYEAREGQLAMFREVGEALRNNQHLLVEAGTGTGKSLGYLLPALYYALKEAKPIVVSTHTIQLQEQLRQRDLPLLQEAAPVPFRAAVFKGRNNYLCLRKFEQQVSVPDTPPGEDEAVALGQLLVWLTDSERGEAEELNMTGGLRHLWDTVASDADSCLNRMCPWFRKCFYHRARHEAGRADLVVTNHAMVFTDMRADRRLLPPYERLIVDEAHHLEDVASAHLGRKTGYASLAQPLQRLWRDAHNGLAPRLIQLLHGCGAEFAPAWIEQLEQSRSAALAVRESWERYMERLFDLIGRRATADEGGNLTLRLRAEAPPEEWDSIRADGDNTVQLLSDLIRPLERMLPALKDEADDLAVQAAATDLNGVIKALADVRSDLQAFLGLGDPDVVYWLEGHAQYRGRSVWMYAVPADVSGLLRDHLFERKTSVVLTSATLTVGRSFQYVAERLGLDQAAEADRLRTSILPSPFRYRDQALLLVPRDFPDIRGREPDARFLQALTESLAEVAEATGGRMLVLFTSHRMLRAVYEPLTERLAPAGIQVLGQGLDGTSRSRLTRQFMDSPASVLLGTSSFWEGVDLPGDALTCLAIVRLPFQPPNHPVAEAKAERLQARSENPFMKLSLPQAVIRFKQGFGRLVRTANDRGIVIIYDTRVIDTRYGKYFLQSLPGPTMEHLPTNGLVRRVKEWFEGEASR